MDDYKVVIVGQFVETVSALTFNEAIDEACKLAGEKNMHTCQKISVERVS